MSINTWAKLEQAIEASEGHPASEPTRRRTIYKTSRAPPPLGPYNQAVRVDDTLYISGQIGLVLGTNILPDNVEEQASLVFGYIKVEFDILTNLNDISGDSHSCWSWV